MIKFLLIIALLLLTGYVSYITGFKTGVETAVAVMCYDQMNACKELIENMASDERI